VNSLQEAETIRRKAMELGLGITSTFGFPPEMDIASEDRSKAAAAVESLRWAVDIAQVLECPVITGILYSALGFTAANPEEIEKRRQRAAAALPPAVEYASRKGVMLCIEPVNRYETDMINTVHQGLDFINRVGKHDLRLLFDVFHASIEERSVPGAIRAAGKHIGHVHFSENTRGIPGSGSLPYTGIIQALREIDYRGWIVLELMGLQESEFNRKFRGAVLDIPPDEAARKSAEYMHGLINL
jgi:D-psicose/D-tagatose/L-ribulose 3-epimerase